MDESNIFGLCIGLIIGYALACWFLREWDKATARDKAAAKEQPGNKRPNKSE